MATGRSLLLFGILVLFGLCLLGTGFFQVQRSILDQESRYMQSVARATASSIHNFVDGCMNSAEMVAQLPHFRMMAEALQAGGEEGPVLDYLRTLSSSTGFPASPDAFLVDRNNAVLAGTSRPEKYVALPGHEIRPGEGKLGVYREGEAGELFLGFATEVSDDAYLVLLIDVGMLYQKTASFVMLGEKGYVMLKHSSGLIITHPVEEQIGDDVIEGRRMRHPGLDYGDLEKLVAAQKSGEEGLLVYYSYWWADEAPQRVQKISAFISVPIKNDFIIVSAVNDYAELRQPILLNSGFNIAAAIAITLGVGGMLLSRRRENQLQIQRENAYLKELNRRQEESQHNQRLQMIGTLAGGIAHEFRNLLTPIMGYSGMMRESLPPDSPLRADLDEIYTSAARAKEIIQEITALGRKNLDPELEPVSLDEILSGVLRVATTFKPSDARIHSRVDFGGKLIAGNKTQISQILLNLCNNAFQAMPDGGNLWVSGGVARDGEGRLRALLTVRDDGVGIEPENLQRIFDPFFTTKRVGEGTGLGLSVVQNIVDLHGGSIAVDSRPGEGSTFSLSFPILSSGVSRRVSAARRRQPIARELISVVLVEDDVHVMRMLHRGLAKSGFSTQAFSEPGQALAEMTRNPCRLLVTDCDLPGMTGVELAKRIREARPEIRILLLTGLADAETIGFAERGIIDSYQIKPVPVSELVERINSLFS